MKNEKEVKTSSRKEVAESKTKEPVETKAKEVVESKQKKSQESNNAKYYWALFIMACILLLFVGWVLGYSLASHKQPDRIYDRYFPHDSSFDRMMQDHENSIRHHREQMEDIFDDLEDDFFEQGRRMFEDDWDDNFEDIDAWRDNHSRGSFQYYQKTTRDWKDTSYEMNWNWNEGDDDWSMVISWVNAEWKMFSFSWTMQDWKSVWVLMDEDWNTKDFSFDDINISDIYESANHIED